MKKEQGRDEDEEEDFVHYEELQKSAVSQKSRSGINGISMN